MSLALEYENSVHFSYESKKKITYNKKILPIISFSKLRRKKEHD